MTEYHYAPMTGSLMKTVNGVAVEQHEWQQVRLLMDEFFDLRAKKAIHLDRTTNYGHDLFCGHSGRVHIYVLKEEA